MYDDEDEDEDKEKIVLFFFGLFIFGINGRHCSSKFDQFTSVCLKKYLGIEHIKRLCTDFGLEKMCKSLNSVCTQVHVEKKVFGLSSHVWS